MTNQMIERPLELWAHRPEPVPGQPDDTPFHEPQPDETPGIPPGTPPIWVPPHDPGAPPLE